MKRRTLDQIQNPERVYFKLIRDYIDGKLSSKRFLYRARVEQIDTLGGQLESSPPNPKNSIKARVYTSGLDANIPAAALNVFYPFFPPHVSPPLDVGEHVYVMFEDDFYSSGLWISPVSTYGDLNYSNPDVQMSVEPTTADTFHNRNPDAPPPVNVDREYGGITVQSQTQQDVRETFSSPDSIWAGKRVLMIGDSMVAGIFGAEVEREILSKNASFFKRDGRVSWGVLHWLRGTFGGRATNVQSGPTLAELMAEHQPDIVIISLGGNDAHLVNRSDYEEKVRQLWEQASQAPQAFWSGPPTAFGRYAPLQPKRDQVAEAIKRVVGGKFIEVRDVTNSAEGRPDGVHYSARNVSAVAPYVQRVVNR